MSDFKIEITKQGEDKFKAKYDIPPETKLKEVYTAIIGVMKSLERQILKTFQPVRSHVCEMYSIYC